MLRNEGMQDLAPGSELGMEYVTHNQVSFRLKWVAWFGNKHYSSYFRLGQWKWYHYNDLEMRGFALQVHAPFPFRTIVGRGGQGMTGVTSLLYVQQYDWPPHATQQCVDPDMVDILRMLRRILPVLGGDTLNVVMRFVQPELTPVLLL